MKWTEVGKRQLAKDHRIARAKAVAATFAIPWKPRPTGWRWGPFSDKSFRGRLY